MVWIDEERQWNYRKSHIINGSSGAGANYTVQLQLHYGGGSDNGSHVYLNGKCKSDFSDIRFTASDATTKLAYWIESKTDGSIATVWVKINGNLDSNQTIFLYYGNADAVSESNQFTTGITQLREQKTTSSYNPDFTYSIDNSTWLKINSTTSGLGSGWAFIVVPKSWINGKYLRWSWKGEWDYTVYSYEWSVRIYDGICTSYSDELSISVSLVSSTT
jgi:hypothetical protein